MADARWHQCEAILLSCHMCGNAKQPIILILSLILVLGVLLRSNFKPHTGLRIVAWLFLISRDM